MCFRIVVIDVSCAHLAVPEIYPLYLLLQILMQYML
jgi:hypothetical protein